MPRLSQVDADSCQEWCIDHISTEVGCFEQDTHLDSNSPRLGVDVQHFVHECQADDGAVAEPYAVGRQGGAQRAQLLACGRGGIYAGLRMVSFDPKP